MLNSIKFGRILASCLKKGFKYYETDFNVTKQFIVTSSIQIENEKITWKVKTVGTDEERQCGCISSDPRSWPNLHLEEKPVDT
jgi:hypothetical protein